MNRERLIGIAIGAGGLIVAGILFCLGYDTAERDRRNGR